MNTFKNNFINYAKELIASGSSNIHIIEELNSISKLWITEQYFSINNLNFENEKASGYFMSTVIQELYSIFLKFNSGQASVKQMIKTSVYREEILLYNRICYVLGMSKLVLLFTPNKNDMARNYMREKFFYLTKDRTFWDKLEKQLDLFSNSKCRSEDYSKYLDSINLILQSAMEYAVINGQKDNLEYDKFNKTLVKKPKKKNN